ncbi:MAG: DoxX family protein [Actinomycetota bacterium]
MVLAVCALVSSAAFLYYGVQVVSQPRLEAEFVRYGIPDLRLLVGVLEILGAIGVLVGLAIPQVGAAAAAGLAALMLLGLAVRARLRDPLRQMLPAALLAGLNGVLVALFLIS